MEVLVSGRSASGLTAAQFISELRSHHRRPGRCRGGPRLEYEGRNCVTVGWDRPEDTGSSPVIFYKLEIWEAGSWREVSVTNGLHEEIFGLEGEQRLRVSAGNCHGWGESLEGVLDFPKTSVSLPEFSLPLKGQISAAPGDSISLQVKVVGYPKPELSWYKNGEELDETGPVLELNGLTEGGLYTCEAKNVMGRISTHAYITLVPLGSPQPPRHQIRLLPPEGEHGPEIVYPLRDRVVELGELVRLTLEVLGEPKPSVEWQKDGRLLESGEFRTLTEGNFHTLEFTATAGSEGHYTARAHGLGIAVTSADVTVHQRNPCAFILPLEPYVRAKLGGHLRLTAKLAPHLRLAKVTWSRDGVHLVQTRSCVMTHSAGGEVTLELAHLTKRAAGLYTCTAAVKGGVLAESTCQIEVVDAIELPLASYQSIPYSQKPLFITKPKNIDVLEGDTVLLKCEVVGDPSPEVTWLRDNLKLSRYSRERGEFRERRSGAECWLEIRHAKLDYTGKYTALATNSHGEAAAVLTLQVFAHGQGKAVKSSERGAIETETESLPLVSRPLSDTAISPGDSLLLQCRIKAAPSPVVLWLKDDKLVRRGRCWEESDTYFLEIAGARAEDQGVYTCTASNTLGTATTSAFVSLDSGNGEEHEVKTISPSVTRCGVSFEDTERKRTHKRPCAPRLTSVPHSQVVREGEPVRLTCTVSGWPEPSAAWTKRCLNGLSSSAGRWRCYEEGDRRFLTIQSACQADSGVYTVTVSNTRGSVQASATVQVVCRRDSKGRRVVDRIEDEEYQPTGEPGMWGPSALCQSSAPSQPLLQQGTGMETSSDLLEEVLPETISAVEGQSLLISVTTTVDGARVRWEKEGQPLPNCQDLEQKSDGRHHSLRIKDVFLEDGGLYSCRVIAGGRQQICRTSLVVSEADVGKEKGARLVRPPQDTTALRGSRVVLQAVYTGSPCPTVIWSKGGRRLKDCSRLKMTCGDGVATLVIDPVIADDSGKYLVTVTNRLATDTQFASLSVTGAPDPPAGRPSVSSSTDGVTIAWSSPHYDGGAMITGYTIEVSEDGKIWTTVAHCSDRLSETVRSLSPGASYSFRVRSHNSHGPSDPGPPSHPFTVTHSDVSEEKYELVQVEPGSELERRYSIMEEIGKGRYGLVKRALEVKSGEIRAAKYVRTVKRQDRESVGQEVDIMNSLRHPLLLRLIGAFELPKDIVLIVEYVSGGELFERVAADDFTLTERDCILFMRQICEAVAYMHSQSIVHLDLKPENIMCTSRNCHLIKIIDFGLAKRISTDSELKVMLGTPEFIPPEIINYEPVGFQSDMWSVGVIAYVLLSGLSPFMGENDPETFANITRAQFDFDDEAFDNISEDAKDFISNLLIKRKEKRLSAEECLRHKWISQGDDTMSQIKLSTEKLKKFIIRRKWQKTGNAIRALGRMANLSRRNGSPSRGGDERQTEGRRSSARPVRAFSERSDSGFSDTPHGQASLGLEISIEEEEEELHQPPPTLKVGEPKPPSPARLKPSKLSMPPFKPTKEVHKTPERKIPGAENIQKAFAFWNR